MATDSPTPAHAQREHCEDCGRETDHAVAVEIRQEGDPASDGVAYSREPYRVATCRRCGAEQVQRMNNA